MIHVLIAERNPILRRGMQSALAVPGFRIVAEAASPAQLLWCLASIGHDVLVIEAEFLRQVDTRTLDEYTAGAPAPGRIVHSYVHDPMQGLAALQNGAHAYLTNRCSPLELRNAIARAAFGKRYIDNALAEELASYLSVFPHALPTLLLSPVELRVYKMLGMGLTLSGIAAQLNLGLQAVTAHKMRILEKLAPDGIAELVREANGRNRLARTGEVDTACSVAE